jgi:hypothetical protein
MGSGRKNVEHRRSSIPISREYGTIQVSIEVMDPARVQVDVSRVTGCAVKGAGPQRGYTRLGTGSLHPVAIRAAVEATRLLKPLGQRVASRLGEHAGRNVSER